MTASLSGVWNVQEFTDVGVFAVNGRLYTYAYGTTTHKAAFTDAAGMVPHTYTSDGAGGQYIALDARGELPAPLYLAAGSYDIALKRPSGSTVWTRRADPTSDPAADMRDDLASTASGKGATLVGFKSFGTAAVSRTANEKLQEFISVKDFGAAMDGTTDDTFALAVAASAARALGAVLLFPSSATPCKVSGTVDFSDLHVIATGRNKIHIQATSAQFDVVKTTGNTTLQGLYIHGGWDGSTTGQSGDAIAIKATSPAYPYNVHIKDCQVQYAKRHGIYWERGGYSSCTSTKINACGLHGLVLYGNTGSDACTTVTVGGNCTFSDTPNGYGAFLRNCISVAIDGAVMENTKGIYFDGIDNRAISLNNIYQENTLSPGRFADLAFSSGIGLSISNCFGAGAAVSSAANWQNVSYFGNSLLIESGTPLNGRVVVSDGGEATTSVAGTVTAAVITLPPGTWKVFGAIQTINAASAGIDKLGLTITSNIAAGGVSSATNSGFVFGSDEQTYSPGSGSDMRASAFDIFENSTGADITLYLRAYIGRTAGTIAYRAVAKSVKM